MNIAVLYTATFAAQKEVVVVGSSIQDVSAEFVFRILGVCMCGLGLVSDFGDASVLSGGRTVPSVNISMGKTAVLSGSVLCGSCMSFSVRLMALS